MIQLKSKLLTCSFAFLIITLISCKNKENDIKAFANHDELLTEKGINVDLIYSDSAIIRVKVFCPVILRRKNQNGQETVMPKGIKATFLDVDGNITSNLKSNYAIRDEVKKIFTLTDNVHVTNENGDTMLTNKLIWLEKEDKLISDQLVTVKTKTETITGEGFESNQNFTKYSFKKIKGNLKINNE